MRRLVLLGALLGWASGPSRAAALPLSDWRAVPRIVAVGDVHGAYDNLVAILETAGLVDGELHWSGGKAHLVQLGDVVDRGSDSRKCMDLLARLEQEAERAGGRVHVLIGNHEAFNVVGVLDYVSPDEFASYVEPDSKDFWEREFKDFYQREQKKVRDAGRTMPGEGEVRKVFAAKYPLGYFEHRRAFGPDGRYGKWIRERLLAVRVNGVVFSHGDWTEQTSALGLDAANQQLADELAGRRPLEGGIIFDARGPLQNRWLSKVPLDQQEGYDAQVDRILESLQATRLVVGHTVTDGFIEPRFGGKHLSIDLGMLEIYQGGHRVALELEGDAVRAIHPRGKVDVPLRLGGSVLYDYMLAVSKVDPENVEVMSRVAEALGSRGQLTAARDALEQLFRIPKPVPFRYRKDLGDVYVELGVRDKAREQYSLYINGLKDLIDATPGNPHLKNLLARFAIDQMMELNLAEQMIRAAVTAQPENVTFLNTFGRLQIVLRQFAQAAETLEKASAKPGADYTTHYQLGLAYVGLKQTEKARGAFENALKMNPSGTEAREALKKLDVPSGGSDL